MFENPRRGRQARNFTTNVPKILDLKSSSEQIFSRKLSLGAPDKRETIVKFINLVLTCNNLTFQGQHFVQQTGTAMGTKMAPSYANLYMGRLEDHFLKGATDKPLMWFRYIDDIFFIWTHGEEKLTDFFNFCNSFDPHIKFEQTKSTTSIPFLDVQVINSNGKLALTCTPNLPIPISTLTGPAVIHATQKPPSLTAWH